MLIRISDVQVNYGHIVALDGINLEMPRGVILDERASKVGLAYRSPPA